MTQPYAKMKKADLIAELERLESEFQKIKNECENLKAEREIVQQLKNEYEYKVSEEYWKPKHNERNAGRKTKLDASTVEAIKQYRESGLTYAQIAKELSLSVGAVHKGSRQ